MNTAVLFLLLLCQKQLFTCVKCGAVCVCVCARACVQGCECHSHSAPVKRKASPQCSLSQLHPTTWPQTPRLPITLCHVSDFCSHIVLLVASLTCEHAVVSSTPSLFSMLQFSSSVSYGHGRASLTKRFGAKLWATFPHWACVAADRWRYSLGIRWLRCDGSINKQQVRRGGGGTTAISHFSLQQTLLLDRKIGQERAEYLGGWREIREEGFSTCSFSTNIFLAVVIIRES